MNQYQLFSCIRMMLLCLLVQLFGSGVAFGQTIGSAGTTLEANEVSTYIRNGGDLFWDGTRALYTIEGASAIFASGLWIGGQENGNTYTAATTYRSRGNDFFVGTLVPDPQSPGSVTLFTTGFDKVWKVSKWQIESHIADYNDDGIIQQPIAEIMAWPGRNNPYFTAQNGGVLPSNRDYAPFFDRNNDGTYNPLQGDYPVLQTCPSPVVPDQMCWFVFNDLGPHGETRSQPMQVEVHCMVYGFSLQPVNDLINRSTFVKYKVINQSNLNYTNLKLGFWNDFDLGCERDDFLGSIPSLQTYYAYNSSNTDPQTGCSSPGYGNQPPVQATTVLSANLDGFSYYYGSPGPSASISDPAISADYYNYLSGLWKDGTAMRAAGDGYMQTTGAVTRHAFTGNPNQANQWTMQGQAFGDIRSLGVTDVNSLVAGQSLEWVLGLSYHRENSTTATNLSNVEYMAQRVPLLQSFYQNCYSLSGYAQSTNCLTPNCIWTGDSDRNNLVNCWDYLTLGTAIGQSGSNTGASRAQANSSWPQNTPNQSWSGNTPYGVNHQYLDFNGDGVLNINDKPFIDNKLGAKTPFYSGVQDPTTRGGKLKLKRVYGSPSIIGRNLVLNARGDAFTFEAVIDTMPLSGLAGISFELEYEKCKVRETNISTYRKIIYWSIGYNANMFGKDFSDLGLAGNDYVNPNVQAVACNDTLVRLPFASVRTSGLDTMAQSLRIARLSLRLAQLDTTTLSPSGIDTLWFRFRNVKGIMANGTTFTLEAEDLPVLYGRTPVLYVGNEEVHEVSQPFTIYPNPSLGDFTIELNAQPEEGATASIFNLLGQIISIQPIISEKSELQIDAPAGAYYLRLTNGKSEFSKMIIKQ